MTVSRRQLLTERPAASGRWLIECPGYTYRVLVTSMPFTAELLTRMSAGLADRENRIKELYRSRFLGHSYSHI
jgi:hypothetical protein